ncbi:MAG: hypothetical protein EOP51_17755 [Sphingobacteriales bacterium]|nr:MAG: hypothetical protein EOP51_17755 [Sphingobacteriales bacterium]
MEKDLNILLAKKIYQKLVEKQLVQAERQDITDSLSNGLLKETNWKEILEAQIEHLNTKQ